MKILVVDDDRIARKVLRAFLEDAHYQVVTVDDGKQAIDAMLAPDAPPIMILDWVMPGMSGPEVCAKLRAAQLKFRPYVVMLSSKTDKNEVVAGLDAGADDFLSKPFNLGELLARLRVAQRMVEYEVELHQKIAELEALEQRHRLLGDLLATPGAEGSAEQGARPEAAAERSKAAITLEQLAPLACTALAQLGLGEARQVEAPPDFQPLRVSYAAWVAVIAIDEQRWIDLLVEASPAVIGNFLTKTLHRRSNVQLPKPAFLAEALTVIGAALRTELRQRTCDTLMPFLSRGLYVERPRLRLPVPDDALTMHLEVGGDLLQLTAVDQPAPFRRKSSNHLRIYDVLAEAYPPPSVNEVALLNRGAILNDRFIEKLASFAEATSEQHPIPVYAPTPLAAFFNREGER
ncbi:MAG TPA: response regulator transcription factor [Opitutaceae bacterium]|nr:response regulator transcription factor [Opitutaceae bacterium]